MAQGISVVIPTKGRAEQMGEVMESLQWQSHPIRELVIVDDSGEDDRQNNLSTIQAFRERKKPSFAITHMPGRGIGAADARNQGAEACTGDVVSFIDDDVVLERDYYREVMKALSDPGVAGVTGVITNYHPVSFLWTIINKICFQSTVSSRRGYLRRSGLPCFLIRADAITDVEVMSGSNMSYRSEVFSEHLFDARLKGYSYLEDADLSYRVSRDHRLVMNPSCRLVHNSFEKGVDLNYHQVKLSYHRYIFSKHLSRNPLNLVPYGLSVIATLADAASRSLSSGDRRFMQAAFRGLSKEHRVR